MSQPLHRKLLGNTGETIASEYLTKEGYRVLQRNFRARYGEIDIICTKNGILVFVEVKTRAGQEFGLPEEAVTPKKLQEVVHTAEIYVSQHPGLSPSMRVDVIGIELNEKCEVVYFNHIENVTS